MCKGYGISTPHESTKVYFKSLETKPLEKPMMRPANVETNNMATRAWTGGGIETSPGKFVITLRGWPAQTSIISTSPKKNPITAPIIASSGLFNI